MSETTNDDEYFEPYVICGARHAFKISVQIYNCLYNTTVDAVNSEQGKALGISLLWTFSKLCVYAERGGLLLYNSNYYVKCGVDHYVSIKEWIDNLTNNKKIEPKCNNWIHICRISSNDQSYSEIYDELSDTVTEKDCETKYRSAYLSVLNNSKHYINYKNNDECAVRLYDENHDTCVIMKKNNLYYVDICDGIDSKLCIEAPIVKSNCVPISIVYKHPDMMEEIDLLFIPNEMYCVNNCLFSKAFVRRCLEYQDKPFIFDDCYTINIIDSNVTMYTMTENHYMKILVDKFQINKLEDTVAYEDQKESVLQSDTESLITTDDDDKSIDSENESTIEYEEHEECVDNK